MADFSEVKSLIEDQGRAWEEFKKTNDDIIKAKADGAAVGDLETKLGAISERMDKLAELKTEFDQFVIKSNRPGLGGADSELETEAKAWNAMLRADFQSKGRPVPAEVSPDAYAQYKSAFFSIARNGAM